MNGLNKSEWITLGAAIIIIVVLIIFGRAMVSPPEPQTASATSSLFPMNQNQQPQASAQQPNNQPQVPNISKDPNIQIYDYKVGTGPAAKSNSTVNVNYIGMLTNGTKFDASADHGGPFQFTLGQNKVIKGWEVGLVGMKVGGQRRLVISPSYGYGSQTVGSIPANSTLVFDIELVSVK